jgi:hypothetical protein
MNLADRRRVATGPAAAQVSQGHASCRGLSLTIERMRVAMARYSGPHIGCWAQMSNARRLAPFLPFGSTHSTEKILRPPPGKCPAACEFASSPPGAQASGLVVPAALADATPPVCELFLVTWARSIPFKVWQRTGGRVWRLLAARSRLHSCSCADSLVHRAPEQVNGLGA